MSLFVADLHSGIVLKYHQFVAIVIKRFLYSRRDKKSLITQFLLPLLFVMFGLLIIKTGGNTANDPPRVMTLENISRHDPASKVSVFYADLRNLSRGTINVDGQTIEIGGSTINFNGSTITFNGTTITTNATTIDLNWMDVFQVGVRAEEDVCTLVAWWDKSMPASVAGLLSSAGCPTPR